MCSEMNNGNVHKDKATTIEQKKLQLFLYIFIFVICIKIVQLENKYVMSAWGNKVCLSLSVLDARLWWQSVVGVVTSLHDHTGSGSAPLGVYVMQGGECRSSSAFSRTHCPGWNCCQTRQCCLLSGCSLQLQNRRTEGSSKRLWISSAAWGGKGAVCAVPVRSCVMWTPRYLSSSSSPQ